MGRAFRYCFCDNYQVGNKGRELRVCQQEVVHHQTRMPRIPRSVVCSLHPSSKMILHYTLIFGVVCFTAASMWISFINLSEAQFCPMQSVWGQLCGLIFIGEFIPIYILFPSSCCKYIPMELVAAAVQEKFNCGETPLQCNAFQLERRKEKKTWRASYR